MNNDNSTNISQPQNTPPRISPIGYDVKMFSFLAILGILFRIIFGIEPKVKLSHDYYSLRSIGFEPIKSLPIKKGLNLRPHP